MRVRLEFPEAARHASALHGNSSLTLISLWHRRLWLIDHGAAFYFHHAGGDYARRARDPFPQIADHVLLPFAGELAAADAPLAARLTEPVLHAIVALVPDAWLAAGTVTTPPQERRIAYLDYLRARLAAPRPFVEEAIRARAQHV